MSRYLGRWSASDVAGIPATRIGPSPGAMVPQIGERPAPRKPAQHVHVHLPRSYTRDQAPPASNNPSATGFPISAGDTFVASDCGADGFSLKRVHVGDADKDGMETPPGDAVFGATDPPGAASSLDQLRARMAPRAHDRTRPAQVEHDQLRAMQEYNDRFWAPRS